MTSDGVRHVKGEFQGDVNVVVGSGSDSRIYDELRINEVHGHVRLGGDLAAAHQNAVARAPQLQQPPQGSRIQWERFLHVGSIKVMLVENDDSTRHIVAALLRNCNYEVIEATNGFQAWKILEDLSNQIDIVLTEVVMPSFSGIGLLCKIMSHKTRRNIPVIMMSSHDSMGLVFKCLSRGAADFLLKPIRKNELKILWQHVWRRCHSSSGSGSESCTNAQKSVNSKRSDGGISITGDDIEGTSDGSDDGSGTQSSWTKQAVELESPQTASLSDQIAEQPDSTCGLVIHSAETPAARDFQDQEGHEDDVGKGNVLAIGGYNNSEMQITLAVRTPWVDDGKEHLQDFDCTQNIRGDDIDMLRPRLVNEEFEALKEPKNILYTNKNIKVMDESRETVTELSLKNPRGVKEVQNGHNVLRHSELSAFTRYNTASNATRTGITCSSSQLDHRSENMKESTRDALSDGYLTYQGLNEAVPGKPDDIPPADLLDPQRVHQIHHHHDVDSKQPAANHEDSGLKELATSAPHCGSSNVFGGAVIGNTENYSMNRSASGSRHGSNGQNGSSTAVNIEGKNGESVVGGLTGKSGSGGDSGSGSENRIDQHKTSQRGAALMKFPEKRKDRCFQKKVRYQNRKRLAEERPHLRGEFVKQTGREGSGDAEDV